jgi:hypothetical protein
MGDMKEFSKEEAKLEQKKNTVTSTPYFNFSVRPAKLIETTKKVERKDEVKLFDFGSSEIKESFVENPD